MLSLNEAEKTRLDEKVTALKEILGAFSFSPNPRFFSPLRGLQKDMFFGYFLPEGVRARSIWWWIFNAFGYK
jgi:hypothetical protein